MVIDFRKDQEHAQGYRVLDAETGEDLTPLPIWYADDEAGVYRTYDTKPGPNGPLFVEIDLPDGTPDIAWTEHRRAIRLVPKD